MIQINYREMIDILERASCVVDYMASSIATKEVNALIEQAGAFIILSNVSDNIKEAMEFASVHTQTINDTIIEALKEGIIDDRFERLLSSRLCEAGV